MPSAAMAVANLSLTTLVGSFRWEGHIDYINST